MLPRTYDVAVIVMGPRQTVVTRRKGRIVGGWVNQQSRTFYNVPSFLGVLAPRALNEITSADILRRQGIGLKDVLFDAGVAPGGDDPFLVHFIDIRRREGVLSKPPCGPALL